MVRRWMGGALVLFFLASVLGLFMRYMVFAASPILPYTHILHAHSHTALLGFGFLFILGSYLFVVLDGRFEHRRFYRLGLMYFGASMAMAFSFLYQSYGAVSITFSTIVMFLAYLMVYRFLKIYRQTNREVHHPLIRWSLYWFVLSTAGIWILGPTAAILGKSHDLYFLSIQFFLHFQFNGWFTYAALGLILFMYGPPVLRHRMPTSGLLMLNTSLILTYFLSVTYVDKKFLFFSLNSVGVILQLAAYIIILLPVYRYQSSKQIRRSWHMWVLWTGVICLICKVLIQGLVAFPGLAEASYSVREFIVGYIHLILLGGTTMTIGGVLLDHGILPKNRWASIGWIGLIATFIVTETILFGHGIATWQGAGNSLRFVRMIFYTTIPFPAFTGLIAYAAWKKYGVRQNSVDVR